MDARLIAVLRYLRDRTREASTWRGLVLLATAFGATISPLQADAIIVAGLAIAGVLGAAFPDGA